jgi:MFS family permease
MPEQEYLVFVEEDDEGYNDDRLVLHVGAKGRTRHLSDLEIQPEIEVEVLNRGSNLATIGLACTFFGALAGLAAIVVFAMYYPDGWRLDDGSYAAAPWFTALLGSLAALVLLVGAVLTPIGRRIEARGILRRVRVVEKPEPGHAAA